ncbi:MAG: selenocysteine-specific translation elongation factor [Gammaproteobacteria bacterium]|nr:selenocysteine-specific translation elongation factor [Gammaproteobacteria bacterium]
MIVTLAGHVDHGKTSLVRALTGVDTDRLAEEKRRGLTIDLGFAYANLDNVRIGFVDVPGHHRFVHNMVAGVAAQQTALIAIAADDGVMPQTIEHLAILELIGVRHAIVAITKADRVEAARLHDAIAQANALLDASSLARIATIPTSVTNGAGIEDLRHALAKIRAPAPLQADAGFRLAVDRAFNVRGAGLVVTGTIHSGSVAEGDELLIAPSGESTKARAIRVQDQPATRARAGERCALNLSGIDVASVGRGCWIVAPSAFAPSQRIAVELKVAADRPRPVKHWLRVHAYHATSHAQGHIALLDGAPIGAGGTALVELVLDAPFNAKRGDRIILRDHGMDATLGGGEVIDYTSPPRNRRRPERLAQLRANTSESVTDAVTALLTLGAIDPAHLQANWNLADAARDALFDPATMIALRRDGRHYWEGLARWQSWLADALERIGAYHKAAPHSPGLKRDQLRPLTKVPPAWLDAVVAELTTSGRIKDQAGYYSLPQYRAKLPDADERLLRRVERTLTETEQPPSLGDLSKQLGVDLSTMKSFVQRMAAEGLLVRVADKRIFMPAFVARMADIAIELDHAQPTGFSAKDFRDRSGIGRNLVIDLLEHFDKRAFTRRYGDLRRIVGDRNRL